MDYWALLQLTDYPSYLDYFDRLTLCCVTLGWKNFDDGDEGGFVRTITESKAECECHYLPCKHKLLYLCVCQAGALTQVFLVSTERCERTRREQEMPAAKCVCACWFVDLQREAGGNWRVTAAQMATDTAFLGSSQSNRSRFDKIPISK